MSSSKHLFFVLRSSNWMMLLCVDSLHASSVTALVVHQNEAFGTSFANFAKDIVLTTKNVDKTFALIEMIEMSALKASALVFGGSFAGHRTDLRMNGCTNHG